ncbi:MAG: DUF3352 domain-containing protein [Candidatus Omnitrophica bacterium]|nr:DUF3352 domain-containing protein [Candidatus Omnitrophota bacterium]
MKKLIIILVCIGLVAVGAAIFLHVQKKGVSFEAVLPEGAFIYLRLDDVEKSMKQISSMPLWKAVSGINFDALADKNVISAQQKSAIDLVKTTLSQVSSNPMAKKLFGREIALAVYPIEKDMNALVEEIKMFRPQVIEEILSGVFLVARVDPDVQLAEFLSRSFSQYGANVSEGQVEYEGEIIRTITLSNIGVKFSFVRLKDVLVFGMGEKAAQTSIDVFKGKEPSLARSPQFGDAMATIQKPLSSLMYFDFKTFLALIKGQVKTLASLGKAKDQDPEAQKQWEDILARMSGIKTFVFSSRFDPVMEFDAHLFLDPGKLDPEYAALYTCPSQENETINFVPKDVLGYQWSNCFDLGYYWKELKKEAAKTADQASRINEWGTNMGINIEQDILPAFGDEIGGFISDITVGGLFPIPKLLFFLEVKNKAKAEALLKRLKDLPMAMLQDENYNGVDIKYLELPFGADVQPGYCFLENYLLVATARQLLKDSVNASKDNSLSLLSSPVFKDVNFGLTDKNRSVQFVRIKDVMDKIRGVIGWSNNWIDAQRQKAEAFKKGSEKPLEEVNANISAKEGELQEIRNNLARLEDEAWSLESKGGDITALQAQMDDLKNQIETKELELYNERERKQDLEKILKQNELDSFSYLTMRQVFLDEVIYPVVEGFKSVISYGARVTMDKNVLKSSLFFKMTK